MESSAKRDRADGIWKDIIRFVKSLHYFKCVLVISVAGLDKSVFQGFVIALERKKA